MKIAKFSDMGVTVEVTRTGDAVFPYTVTLREGKQKAQTVDRVTELSYALKKATEAFLSHMPPGM